METDSAKVCTLVPKVSLMLGSGSPSLLGKPKNKSSGVQSVKESIPRHLKAGICAVQSSLGLHLSGIKLQTMLGLEKRQRFKESPVLGLSRGFTRFHLVDKAGEAVSFYSLVWQLGASLCRQTTFMYARVVLQVGFINLPSFQHSLKV